MLDDLVFRNFYLSLNGGSEDFSFSSWLEYYTGVRHYDNGRLANFLSPIATTFIPRWMFASLTGAAVAAMLLLMNRIAEVELRRRGRAALAVWASSLVLLPWRNMIMVNDYLLNYVYSTVAVLLFLLILCRVADENRGMAVMAVGVVLALIAGWFHEGFSVPLCAGLGVYALCRRLKMTWQWWTMVVVFGLATFWVFFSPGTLSRAEAEVGFRSWSVFAKVFATSLPAVVLFSALLIVMCFKERGRAIIKSLWSKQNFVVLTVAAYAAAAITFFVKPNPRAAWPAEIFAMSAMLCFLPYLNLRLGRRFISAACWALYFCLCLFFINVLRWQVRFDRQNAEVNRLMERSASGTIFYDIIDPRSMRAETLYLPTRNEWLLSFQYNILNDEDLHHGKTYAVVPKVLSDFSADAAIQIAGNGGLMDYKGILLAPTSDGVERSSDDVAYNFEMADGRELEDVICVRISFIDKDGFKRLYIYPVTQELNGGVVRADFAGCR